MKWINKQRISQIVTKGESRIAEDSALYGKAIPVVLIGMVVIMMVLIILAVGVLIGFIPFLSS
jgi:hypothetical protein